MGCLCSIVAYLRGQSPGDTDDVHFLGDGLGDTLLTHSVPTPPGSMSSIVFRSDERPGTNGYPIGEDGHPYYPIADVEADSLYEEPPNYQPAPVLDNASTFSNMLFHESVIFQRLYSDGQEDGERAVFGTTPLATSMSDSLLIPHHSPFSDSPSNGPGGRPLHHLDNHAAGIGQWHCAHDARSPISPSNSTAQNHDAITNKSRRDIHDAVTGRQHSVNNDHGSAAATAASSASGSSSSVFHSAVGV
jgi:hypothetical protein